MYISIQAHDSLSYGIGFGWQVNDSEFNGTNTDIIVECGFEGDTQIDIVTVPGEPVSLSDAVRNHGCYQNSTGPITGGGFPPTKK